MTALQLLDATPARKRWERPGAPDLCAMSLPQLTAFITGLGEPAYRAQQVFRWIHKRSARTFADMTDISRPLREKLAAAAQLGALDPAEVKVAADGTRKYRFRTFDGHLIESVFIPHASASDKNTLCISSQVGCAMACAFCATGAMGLERHLSAGEIVDQVNRVWADLGAGNAGTVPDPDNPGSTRRVLTNLVFMGMGEPLHNVDNVFTALHILTHDEGHQFSGRRVTVSTSGLLPQMRRLMEETDAQLAVSLSGTTDEQRVSIMPVNKKYPLAELLGTCAELPIKARRRITFEYVLLEGVNDRDEDARRLVGMMAGLQAKVNLIPFNEHPLSAFKRPSRNRTVAFQNILKNAGVQTLVREARGDDIDAACGMLGGKTLQARREELGAGSAHS